MKKYILAAFLSVSASTAEGAEYFFGSEISATLICQSQNNKRKVCYTPEKKNNFGNNVNRAQVVDYGNDWIMSVELKTKYSQAKCEKDHGYGMTEDGGIWVHRGCRGEFIVKAYRSRRFPTTEAYKIELLFADRLKKTDERLDALEKSIVAKLDELSKELKAAD